MNGKSKTTLGLGTVKVRGVIFGFATGQRDEQIVCGLEEMDWIEFREQFPEGKRATGLNLDGYEERFFLFYVEDCFDPPVAVVRASNEAEAEEIFVEELDWAHVDDQDAQDTDEDSWGWGPSGQRYDREAVMFRELKLIGIIN